MILRNSSNRPLSIDGYKIISQLGHGGFGTVYKVMDKKQNTYALKLLHKVNNIYRIQKQLNVLKILNTSNLFLKTYASKKLLDKYYILMEYSPDVNLDKVVKKERFTDKEAKVFLESMVEILKFLHNNKIIHGDIKAENILNKDGKYFLIDYDVVKTSPKVKTLHIQGDDDFSAPEVYKGYQTFASDIYSLGCTLYCLLCGEHIYKLNGKSDFSSKMFAHIYSPPLKHANISPKMFYLIGRMTDKDDTTRITLEEILIVLEDNSRDFMLTEVKEVVNLTSEFDRYQYMSSDGISYAQNIFGLMYENNKEYTNAVKWYDLAQKQGLVKAKFNLALCYKYAKGCPKDYEKARQLFEEAAEENHNRSLFYLADIYESGLGVTQNLNQAKVYYKRAAEHGYKPAYQKLKELF